MKNERERGLIWLKKFQKGVGFSLTTLFTIFGMVLPLIPKASSVDSLSSIQSLINDQTLVSTSEVFDRGLSSPVPPQDGTLRILYRTIY